MNFNIPPPPTLIPSGGREVPLRPLYELANGNLAAVEMSFERAPDEAQGKMEMIRQVLRAHGAGLAPGAYVCAPMGEIELCDPHFPARLARVVRQLDVSPSSLCLFFADRLCLSRGLSALDQFLHLKTYGFRLGLDIESLDAMPGLFVERLPADVLRLGPLDTMGLPDDGSTRDILDFTRYADNLLMLPAARGVHSQRQMNILRDLGIRIGQGPFFTHTGHSQTPS